ncbi:site-specific integrase [Vibrio crassostreae]|uniref:site-specific integrase n=1 Tax=Vibrio crassostreae TaxID=246167 RepID=UPI00148CCD01|nr:site-specific integrase [Vibrio crassostreae]
MFTKQERIIVIKHLKNTNAEITLDSVSDRSIERTCSDGGSYFIIPHPAFGEEQDLYLFPFLLNADGSPWGDANSFIFESAYNLSKGYTTSEAIRKKASLLLDYKIYCETNDIDPMVFAGRKPKRPTYRYYLEQLSLLEKGLVTRRSLNQRTKVVYDFYKYLSEQPNSSIDINRVDTVDSVKIFRSGSYGQSYTYEVEKREQSVNVSSAPTPVAIGFVREYGEDLRPLYSDELDELLEIIYCDSFSVDERLIHLVALHTGARKQSILTLRLGHLENFNSGNLGKDGTYKIKAGPGTGIDTKFGKPQTLYFPKEVADQIITYSKSKKAKDRRAKFKAKHESIISEDEMYVFLSPEGEPHYMAKDDPRYKRTKSKPQGRNTYYMKKKLLSKCSESFPKDFSFHWLRATFALKYYIWLQPLSANGVLTDGDIISMVQKRLHHSDRRTTEHYLKLFDSVDERLKAQSAYEERVFDLYGNYE